MTPATATRTPTTAQGTGVFIRGIMHAQAESLDLPTWVRVGCLAWATAVGGHAPLAPGQLARLLDCSPSSASHALARARSAGWIDAASTGRCLVLPGCAANPCGVGHRGY